RGPPWPPAKGAADYHGAMTRSPDHSAARPPHGPLVIVGLGNPGPRHAGDRHNVGFWLVDQLAARLGLRFTGDQKLQGETCRAELGGRVLRLVKPSTYMNRSGQCVRRVLDYYDLTVD